jgi:hypothetical protein
MLYHIRGELTSGKLVRRPPGRYPLGICRCRRSTSNLLPQLHACLRPAPRIPAGNGTTCVTIFGIPLSGARTEVKALLSLLLDPAGCLGGKGTHLDFVVWAEVVTDGVTFTSGGSSARASSICLNRSSVSC